MKSRLSSSAGGFSLIGALISVLIALIGALALMSIADFSLRSQKNVESRADYDTLMDNVKLVLRKPELCRNAFFTVATSPAPLAFTSPFPNPSSAPIEINEIKMGQSTLAKRGQRLPSGSVVGDIQLQAVTAPVPSGANSSVVFEVRVPVVKNSVAYVPGTMGPTGSAMPTTPRVEIFFNSSGTVVDCLVDSTPAASPSSSISGSTVCSAIGGEWDSTNSKCSTSKVIKTSTFELRDRYDGLSPVMCPNEYTFASCSSVASFNSYQYCRSGYRLYDSTTTSIVQANYEYATSMLIEINKACNHYCTGTTSTEHAPKNYSGQGPGTGPGTAYKSGSFSRCGNSMTPPGFSGVWCDIYCLCNN